MNSYQRVMKRLRGEETDKIPNLNIVMGLAADELKVNYKTFCTDYRVLVESKLLCAEKFGIDKLSAISDPVREASALGVEVIIPDDGVPYTKPMLIEDIDKIANMKIINPLNNERTLDRIRAIEEFKKAAKFEYPIFGWIEGCLAEAADIIDISDVMVALIDEPEALEKLFERIFNFQKQFAKAQIDAGADFIGIGNAAASLVGPDLYKNHCLKYDTGLIDYIHQQGAKTKLHICGDTTSILDQLATTGTDIFDADSMVDYQTALDAFEGTQTCVNGNLGPVDVFLNMKPEQVEAETIKLKKICHSNSFISGGCEIPRGTSHENMIIMNKALYI